MIDALIIPFIKPQFSDILKPAYSSVDIIEVELMDNDSKPRDFIKANETTSEFRDAIINQSRQDVWMMMKYHYDNMV